jgi:hypothetical protein
LIKSSTGQFIHWNQKIKFPDDINEPRSNPEVFDEKTARKRPDILYYTNVKKGKHQRAQFEFDRSYNFLKRYYHQSR